MTGKDRAARLRLLLIESSESDAQLILDELQSGGYEVAWERVDTSAALLAAVRHRSWDVILCDPVDPQLDVSAALNVLREHGRSIPVIVVSRQSDDDGIAAMKEGARDFVDKRRLARLCPVVARELRDAQLRRAFDRAEQELRLGGEIAAQLGDSVHLVRVRDGVIVFNNPQFEATFGYAHGEAIGKHVSILNAPTDKSPEDTAREITAALVRDGRWEGEICNRRKDGTIFWCRASVATFDHPRFGHVWASVHRDISDRKRSEDALRESELRYRSLVDASSQLVWTTRPQGVMTGNVSSWNAYTAQSAGEAEGWGWLNALPPEDRERARAEWREAVETKRTIEAEYRVRRRDGEYRDLTVRSVPILAEDGSLREWIVAASDITDLKRLEEQARAHQAELAHVLRVHTMGEMATELAHEINQPLSAIANYAHGCRSLLSSGSVSATSLLPPIEAIITQTLRAGEIVRRLRIFARKGTTIHQAVNLNDLVTDAVNAVAQKARQSSVVINLELSPSLPRIEVDPVQIEQVIVNLLVNGIEATEASHAAQAELSVRTSPSGDETVEVTVRDRGNGVAAEIADEIFEAFVTSKPNGLGMGLPISRSIVERHGGKLWVADNPGGGAVFHVTLPLAQGRESRPVTLET